MASGVESAISFLKRNEPTPGSTLADLRAWVDGLAAGLDMPPDVMATDLEIAGIRTRCFTPAPAEEGCVIIYLHGGAYMAGSMISHGPLAANLAAVSGNKVLLPEYRLAPENPCPAALEDALAIYRWAAAGGGRIVIAGDSAGGGLALALALMLKKGGGDLPAALALISPWTDMTLSGASITANAATDPMISMGALTAGAAAYAGSLPGDDPRLSPLFGDLAGLPPILVQVGEGERLRDDAVRLLERGRQQGVPVTLSIWPDMIHVWHLFGRYLPESRAAMEEIAGFLNETAEPRSACWASGGSPGAPA